MNYKAIIEESKQEIADLQKIIEEWGLFGASLQGAILGLEANIITLSTEQDRLATESGNLKDQLAEMTVERDMFKVKLDNVNAKPMASRSAHKPVEVRNKVEIDLDTPNPILINSFGTQRVKPKK